jgi:putative nucleotidyltransferase with HDIG domain
MMAVGSDCRDRALKSLSLLPPFSPVLNRLLATLTNDDVSFAKISDLIEKDTVIAGNVLKLVNSALYGRRGTINSVRHAVSLLGITKLRNAVFSMSLTRMWNSVRTPPTWSTARFNLHSVAVAIMSDLVAQRLPVAYPEGAFVAGLFHDIGKLLIAVGLQPEYDELRKLAGNGRIATDLEREVLGLTHAELSALAVEAWGLPKEIAAAVEYHHNPQDDPSSKRLGTYSLALVLLCSDSYVNASGAVTAEDPLCKPGDEDPFAPLGLEDHLPLLVQEFANELDAITAFFR